MFDVGKLRSAAERGGGHFVIEINSSDRQRSLTHSSDFTNDLGGFGPLFKREDLYVSCTRAKGLLVAIAHGEQCKEVIAVAQAASEEER